MSPRPATIFIADDNPILLQGLDRALSANGYEVRTAEDGSEVLRMLEESPATPDLLLLDVMMPEVSGLDVLQRIHKDSRWADLPVVLITAASDQHLPVSALQEGAVDFLPKPFRLGELLARVEAHVQRYQELRRARTESQVRSRAMTVVRDLNSVVTADEMFQLVTSGAREIWQVAQCSVLITDDVVRARIAASSAGEPAGSLVELDRYPEVRAALERAEPVLVEDTASSSLFTDYSLNGGKATALAHSALAVPFRITDDTQGVFLLRALGEEPALDADSLSVAEQVVEGMTRALSRAHVFATLIEQRRQLHDLAHTDDLTGCATRRAVLRFLAEELDLARRRETPLAIVLLDLDGLKEVNDRYGHLAGDAVLRTFGEWLRGDEALRDHDCAGRYGGDEFIVVLPETGPEGALRFAERARDHFASLTFVFGDTPVHPSLSAGIAAWPVSRAESAEDLIKAADAALYEAKAAGKACIRLAAGSARSA